MIHAANIVYISILLASQDEENHLLLPKKKVKRETKNSYRITGNCTLIHTKNSKLGQEARKHTSTSLRKQMSYRSISAAQCGLNWFPLKYHSRISDQTLLNMFVSTTVAENCSTLWINTVHQYPK